MYKCIHVYAVQCINRKQLLEKLHNFIHLNLAIALFLAFATFVAGVETAKNNIVCTTFVKIYISV